MPTPLHKRVVLSALKNLDSGVRALEGSEKSFYASYRKVRQDAFLVEFLGKLLRVDALANEAKTLEDALGIFNEHDEMYEFARARGVLMAHFQGERDTAFSQLGAWLEENNWRASHNRDSRMHALLEVVKKINWMTDDDYRRFVAERVAKSLRKLHKAIAAGQYSPARNGYRFTEVETKVHELRRDIRKISMYMSYCGGVFQLSDRKGEKVVEYFRPLTRSPIADESFAKLPRVRIKRPVRVPRPLFLALTRYVAELGAAKDWAHHLNGLGAAGLKGKIDLDHLDLELRNIFAAPVPFNPLVLGILDEVLQKRVFKQLAVLIETQI